MSEQERLQTIIETALKHDFNFKAFLELSDRDKFHSWSFGDDGRLWVSVEFYPTRAIFDRSWHLSHLLYGDNLSLLKAACKESPTMAISSFETDGYDDTDHYFTYNGGIDESIDRPIPFYQWVAQQSVLLPDDERIAFVHQHLRKD